MTTVNLKKLKDMIATGHKPVFVMFSTSWCGVCKMNEPILKPIINKYRQYIDFVHIDADNEKAWGEDGNKEFAIDLVPTFHLYQSKKLLFHHQNFLNPEMLDKILRENVVK